MYQSNFDTNFEDRNAFVTGVAKESYNIIFSKKVILFILIHEYFLLNAFMGFMRALNGVKILKNKTCNELKSVLCYKGLEKKGSLFRKMYIYYIYPWPKETY